MTRIGRSAAIFTIALTLAACNGQGSRSSGPFGATLEPSSDSVSYVHFAEVLARYIDGQGLVDYSGLRENRASLDAFIADLAELKPEASAAWSEPEKIAFWLNAYNAITLASVVDNYPIEPSLLRRFLYPENSIRQIPGVWTEREWIIMGSRYTLDAIEHEVLRVEFEEPRIHAAMVCAAMGCPPLRNEPYTGGLLIAQLNDQMRRFLAHDDKFRIRRDTGIVYLSPIFRWFAQAGGPPAVHRGRG
ncbi:MAG: DUF547 domain-containing protein, partial [Candidatus Hydrogenedentes bacterium]|nr:DUF547 domain-containing protein [Candidatus Hydrogenedentota bacterium]